MNIHMIFRDPAGRLTPGACNLTDDVCFACLQLFTVSFTLLFHTHPRISIGLAHSAVRLLKFYLSLHISLIIMHYSSCCVFPFFILSLRFRVAFITSCKGL